MRTHKYFVFPLIAAALYVSISAAQEQTARPVFGKRTDTMLDTISARMERARKPADKDKQYMMLDFSKVPAPKQTSEFTTVWHQPPVMQGLSGMCWCFSTTSMLESEIHRQTGRSIKLSEMHTVYWEHVEKAREFVRTRGESYLAEGSEGQCGLPHLEEVRCRPGGTLYRPERRESSIMTTRTRSSLRSSGTWMASRPMPRGMMNSSSQPFVAYWTTISARLRPR